MLSTLNPNQPHMFQFRQLFNRLNTTTKALHLLDEMLIMVSSRDEIKMYENEDMKKSLPTTKINMNVKDTKIKCHVYCYFMACCFVLCMNINLSIYTETQSQATYMNQIIKKYYLQLCNGNENRILKSLNFKSQVCFGNEIEHHSSAELLSRGRFNSLQFKPKPISV